MAVTYVGAGSFVGGTGAITPGLPTEALQAGDIAFLFVETANQAVTLSTPNGFASAGTPTGTGAAAATTATLLSVFWKRLSGPGDTAAPTVADSGDHQAGRIGVWRGAKPTGNPWNVAPVWTVDSVADTALAATGVTTTRAGCGIIVGASNMIDGNQTQTVTYSATGITITGTGMGDNSNAGNGGGLNVGFGVQSSAGATGAISVTYGANTQKSVVVIALEPAVTISLSKTALQFSQRTGGGALPSQNITATVDFGETITVSDDAAWLSVSPASGGTGQAFAITPNATGLAAGDYTATVTFAATNAANKTVTVLLRVGPAWASPEFDQSGDFKPANAFDANTNTRYGSLATSDGGPANPWIAYDYGSAQTFNQFTIRWENSYSSSYDIQSSTDGENWTTRATDGATAAGDKVTSFTSVTARYWRIYSNTMVNPLLSMFEITAALSAPVITPSKTRLTFVTRERAVGELPDTSPKTFSVTATQGATVSQSDDATWLSVTPSSGGTGQTFTATIDSTGLAPGEYSATITLTASGATSKTVAVNLVVFAKPTRAKLIGISTGHIVSAGTTEQGNQLQKIYDSGSRLVRLDVDWWAVMGGGSSSYDWAATDTMLDHAFSRGLDVIAVILNTPPWARPGGTGGSGSTPPANNADFASFCTQAVNRYKPGSTYMTVTKGYASTVGIRMWEVWNEANIATFWNPVNVANYTALLQVAYAAIKEADPYCTVLTCGTAPAASDGTNISPLDFLIGIYANGGKEFFDVVAHHPYPDVGNSDTVEWWSAWYQMFGTTPPLAAASLRSTMITNGDEGKEIWATETGMTDAQHPTDKDTLLHNNINDWLSYTWSGRLTWYNLKGDSDWGIVNEDFSAKPAYDAFVAAVAGTAYPVSGDTTPPVVNLTSASSFKMSDETGKDSYSYSFSANEDIQAWKIKVVPSSDSVHTEGTEVENGSSASSGATISGSITYAELVTAGVGLEGDKVLKFFAQDTAGNWST